MFYFKHSVAAAAAVFSVAASASLAADVTPDTIWGSGNQNGDYTVGTGTYGGSDLPVVELGLRGKLRFDSNNQPQSIYNYDGTDTYAFAAGTPPTGFGWDANSPTTPIWNFDWSVNSDVTSGNSTLNALTYELRIDGSAGAGAVFAAFDPINVVYADHGIGTNSTGNSAGTVAANDAEYANLIDSNNVAQNSWNYEFFNEPGDNHYLPELAGFDPSVDGTYRIELEAFFNGVSVAETGINIVVGAGAPAIPLPAGFPLLIGALGGFALLRRRKA